MPLPENYVDNLPDNPMGQVDAADMNAITSAINTLVGTNYHVDDYGSDPTGATSSDAAVAAARAALGNDRGTLLFGTGTYQLSTPITPFGPGQNVLGCSIASTLIKFDGTGALIRAFDSRPYIDLANQHENTAGAGYGGRFAGFTIDGDGSGAASYGLHIGDFTGVEIDVAVLNFVGGASAGLYLDNTVTWCLDARVKARIFNCTSDVIFNGGGFNDFTGDYDFDVSVEPNQSAVVVRNSARLAACRLRLFGICRSGDPNVGAAILVGATDTDNASIDDAELMVSMHTSGAVGIGHKTLSVGDVASVSGYGVLDFVRGDVDWVAADLDNVIFGGSINTETAAATRLSREGLRCRGLLTNSPGAMDSATAVISLTGNRIWVRLTNGAHTVSIKAADAAALAQGGQSIEFDLFIQQPASGAAATCTWPGDWHWLDVTAPTLETGNNAVNHIRVVSVDGDNFYAQHLGHY